MQPGRGAAGGPPSAAPEPSHEPSLAPSTQPLGAECGECGKSGVKLVRVKMGFCRHFLQPGRGAQNEPGARRETHLVSRRARARSRAAEESRFA